ncbi:MAG: DUF87 domain-containing protein [bacterium]
MSNDRTIGRIVLVDSYKAIVEIDKDLKSLTKTAFTGTYDFARINSYVIIPVGSSKIVGMISRVQLTEEAEGPTSKTTIVLPEAKRIMTVTMIGTIGERPEGKQEFYQGVISFPALDNPVWFIEKEELDILFDKSPSGEDSKYRIPIGTSIVFPEYQVRIDPDAFFGKHAAVIGSTGSGKSCTIASILQSIFEMKNVKNAHFVILDTNGEYGEVFKGRKQPYDFLHIKDLKIPYWFMNFDDFRTLFKASEGTQAPVLRDAIVDAKNESLQIKTYNLEARIIENALRSVSAQVERTGNQQMHNRRNAAKTISKLIDRVRDWEANCSDPQIKEVFKKIIEKLSNMQSAGGIDTSQDQDSIDWNTYKKDMKPDEVENIFRISEDIEENLLNELTMSSVTRGYDISVDTPTFFDKTYFRKTSINNAMEVQPGKEDRRLAEYCATLLLRIDSYFNDKRYDFLFHEYKKHPHSLALFLRYIFGRLQETPKDTTFSKDAKADLPYLNEFEGNNKGNYQIIIIDLHLLATEILENITALLGRIILDFLQRIRGSAEIKDENTGKTIRLEETRGEFPVVLILEEAQNYIKEARSQEQESPSKLVFERIAREGRKYGLSLVIASQRLSDLSKTALSQCNSFIVHRLQNPEDLRYFREIVPEIHSILLEQLPSLASQTALILGECVRAPMHVKIRTAFPKPQSKNPELWKHWTSEPVYEPDFEKICDDWEKGVKNAE